MNATCEVRGGELRPDILLAAERLRQAGTLGRPGLPIRDLLGPSDIAAAYQVQRQVLEFQRISGARVLGRKIELIPPAARWHPGVEPYYFGFLLDTMRILDGDTVATNRMLQPRVEAEIAVVLKHDLDLPGPSLADVRSAVGSVAAALEVVDSRIVDWDVTIVDTVADNACAGLYVVSSRSSELGDLNLATLPMRMRRRGVVVSTGQGSASLGDPLLALQWLATTALAQGSALREGETILTGALGPMVTPKEGNDIHVTIGDLAPVSVRFSSAGDLQPRRITPVR